MARCNPDLVHAIIRNMCLPLSWPCTCWLSWTCTCYPRLATIWLCTCYLGLAIILTLYLLTRTCYYPDLDLFRSYPGIVLANILTLTFVAAIRALHLLLSWPSPLFLLSWHCICYYLGLAPCYLLSWHCTSWPCTCHLFSKIILEVLFCHYNTFSTSLWSHVPAIQVLFLHYNSHNKAL